MQAARKIKSVDAKAASVNIAVFAIKTRSDNRVYIETLNCEYAFLLIPIIFRSALHPEDETPITFIGQIASGENGIVLFQIAYVLKNTTSAQQPMQWGHLKPTRFSFPLLLYACCLAPLRQKPRAVALCTLLAPTAAQRAAEPAPRAHSPNVARLCATLPKPRPPTA
jgi:hypothetical protein